MLRFPRLSLCLLPAVLVLAGCSSDEADDEAISRDFPAIHIETSDTGRGGREIVMPVSHLHFTIIGRPIVPQGNFNSTEVYEVGPPELRREALLVRVDSTAAAALYRMSPQARGKRLFLLVGDNVVGVHPIEDTMRNGDIFFDVEVDGDSAEAKHKAIFALRDKLNEVILKIRKKKEAN